MRMKKMKDQKKIGEKLILDDAGMEKNRKAQKKADVGRNVQ